MKTLSGIYRTHKNISSGLKEADLNKGKLYQATMDVVVTVTSSSGTCFVGDSGILPGQGLDYSHSPNVIFIQGVSFENKFYEETPTSARIYLSHAPDKINNFGESWRQLESFAQKRILRNSEISSDNTLPIMEYTLTKKKYNLLLQIRAFRKKVGKIKVNVCDLLRDAREHA